MQINATDQILQHLVYKISDSGELVFLVMAVIRFHVHSCFSVGNCSRVAVASGTLKRTNSDLFRPGPFLHKNLHPAGPILSKKWSAGPKFLPDQNFRDNRGWTSCRLSMEGAATP